MVVRWSSHYEHQLASGDRDGHLLLWDVRRAKNCLRSFDFNNISKKSADQNPSFINERKKLAQPFKSCLHAKRKLSDIRSSRLRDNIGVLNVTSNKKDVQQNDIPIAHNGAVNGILFCDDGKHLISFGCHDGRIRKWDTLSGINKKIKFPKLPPNKNAPNMCMKFDQTSGIVPSPGLIFVPSEDSVVVFNIEDGERLKTLNGHFSNVNCCIYNPYQQELISGGSDRNILVWESNHSQTDAYQEFLTFSSNGSNNVTLSNDLLNVATRDNWSSSDDETDDI